MGDVGLFEAGDGFEIAQLEFGHTAAGFFLDQACRYLVVREDAEQVVADARFVVVDITGRIDRHLAGRAFAVLDRELFIGRGLFAERTAAVFGQLAILMDSQHTVHHLAGDRVFVHRVHRLGDYRNGCQLAHQVGAGQQFVAESGPAFFEFHHLGAQHQMREIQVEPVRRHIRAFGHEAHVAQIALVDDLPVDRFLDGVEFVRRAFVYRVEQGGKCIAQVEAAPTAMTDVIDTVQLPHQRSFVVELGILPIQWMAQRRFKIAFACAHFIPPVGKQ